MHEHDPKPDPDSDPSPRLGGARKMAGGDDPALHKGTQISDPAERDRAHGKASATDSLSIVPFTRSTSPTVTLPGSKSITNRSLILAALSEREVTIENALFSRDTEVMVRALATLGFDVKTEEGAARIRITGQEGYIPGSAAQIDVGNAGTAARFLTAFLCLKKGGHYRLDGDKEMRARPMADLLDALALQGAEVEYEGEEGRFPFRLRTSGLSGGRIELDTSRSTQFTSALLLVAPKGFNDLDLNLRGKRVSHPFIEMTLKMMCEFGVSRAITRTNTRIRVKGGTDYRLDNSEFAVESDATAASYFISLPLVTEKLTMRIPLPPDSIQGDIRYADLLGEATNLEQRSDEKSRTFSFNCERRLRSTGDRLNFNFRDFSDTFLTLAAIAPLFEGPVRISGIGHTRHQETDRIAAASRELRKLGQSVKEEPDAITIHPNRRNLLEKAMEGVTIETYLDHRMAMSFAILGSADLLGNGQSWLSIENPSCVHKTFPRFFEVLHGIH